jgi:hypothetical protein
MILPINSITTLKRYKAVMKCRRTSLHKNTELPVKELSILSQKLFHTGNESYFESEPFGFSIWFL